MMYMPRSARSVLIVDDEPLVRLMLSRFLSDAGWACRTAEDPEQALAILEREAITDALVDLHLGPWSGFDLIRTIARRYPSVRVVAITGSVVSGGEAARAAGAARVLMKPFVELNEVVDALGRDDGSHGLT